MTDAPNYENGQPLLVRLDTVEPERIEWLWDQKIPCGKVSLLCGDPGLGKSLLALDLIARITTARDWPDGAANKVGSVVLASFEDDPADTIRPRLDAAGADVSRVVLLRGVRGYDSDAKAKTVRAFDLARDISALEEAILKAGDCRLVVIDPVTACMGDTDSNNNAEVRAALTPLAELAQRHGVAILCVTHLNKSTGQAMYRTMGSLAFVAAARSAWVVAKDKADPTNRLVLPLKANLSRDVLGMSYRVKAKNGSPVLEWGDEDVTVTAEEALAPEVTGRKSAKAAKRQEVKAWLRELLSDGPMASKDVKSQANAVGYDKQELLNAQKDLQIVPSRHGFGPGAAWSWGLPGIDAQSDPDSHDAASMDSMEG